MKLITYTIEKVIDNLEELKVITKLHYKESAPYDDIPLNINWDLYLRLDKGKALKLYVMRKKGLLIGYAVFFVSASFEYSTSIQASLNNIYLHPKHRGTGLKFISWCDDQLKELGVQVVYHHVKARNDYGKLLKRIGYVTMNIEYSKRLDKR